MKKIAMALIVVIMLAALLSACGGNKTETAVTTITSTTTTTAVSTATTSATTATSTATSTATATDAAKYGGTLRIIYPYSLQSAPGWPPDTLNIQRVNLNWTVWEPLVRLGLDGVPEPYLATAWKWGPNNAYIDFTLRQGVVFHDGYPFTSEAVVLLGNDCIEEKVAIANTWDRWEALDDYNARLYVKKYSVDIFNSLSNVSMMFISPKVFKQGKEYAREHPTGTGPFVYTSWERDVNMVFSRFDKYWKKGRPYLDKIDIMFVTESLTQQSALLTGSGDLLWSQIGKVLNDVQKKGFNIIAKAGGTSFIMFDTANADSTFANVKVRQAVEYALDKPAIADAFGYGYMTATNQLTPSHMFGFNKNLPVREHNVAKAKQLLAEAGYPNGLHTKLITMGAGATVAGQEAVAYQQYLKEAGIDVELVVVDNPGFWEYARKGFHDCMLQADYSQSIYLPVTLRDYFPPTGDHPSIALPAGGTDLIAQALQQTDMTKFKEMSDQLAQMIWDSATFVPVTNAARGFALSPKIHGVTLYNYSAYNMWDPCDVWMDK